MLDSFYFKKKWLAMARWDGHGEMEHMILVMLFYSIYYKLFLYYNCTDHCFFI